MSGLSSTSHNYKKLQGGIEINASAPGKVILHGEHSVVYGKLAIAASLGLRTKISLVEIDCPNALIVKILPVNFEHDFKLNEIQTRLLDKPPFVTSKISDFNWESPTLVNYESHLDLVEDVVNSALDDKNNRLDGSVVKASQCLFYLLSGILSSAKISIKPICITIDTELSIGVGAGSSASYSVAPLFIRYVKLKTLELDNAPKQGFRYSPCDEPYSENKTHFSKRELDAISDWAFYAEKIFHGMPSGLDNTICTFGNLVKFRKGHSTIHLTVASPLNILLINTKVPRETVKMVRHVALLKETFPHVIEHILDAMDDLTISAVESIQKIDKAAECGDSDSLEKRFKQWETLVQCNHSLLCALGVSHQKLEEVIMILGKYGLKGKLTGAGGGGFAISVLPPSYDPEEVMKVLKEHGFKVIATKLGGQGVKVD